MTEHSIHSHVSIDPLKPVTFDFAVGVPGDWKAAIPLAIDLHTNDFDSLHGTGWEVDCGILFVEAGVRWDGSTVVADTDECLLASLVHDLLCTGILTAGWSVWHRWRARRAADGLYTEICEAQGMSTVRAETRWVGLRLFGWIYTAWNRITGNIE